MILPADGLSSPPKSVPDAAGASVFGRSHGLQSRAGNLRLVRASSALTSSKSGAAISEGKHSYSGNENDAKIENHKQEVFMADISKEELNALLRANKAEVDAVASAMKGEMASWREQMRSDLKDVKTAVERQTDKLESNFLAQQTKLDAAIQIQTARLEKTVSDTRLDIIRWVLGIPALAFTLWKIYEAIAH